MYSIILYLVDIYNITYEKTNHEFCLTRNIQETNVPEFK